LILLPSIPRISDLTGHPFWFPIRIPKRTMKVASGNTANECRGEPVRIYMMLLPKRYNIKDGVLQNDLQRFVDTSTDPLNLPNSWYCLDPIAVRLLNPEVLKKRRWVEYPMG
jgi:hypothetical protein